MARARASSLSTISTRIGGVEGSTASELRVLSSMGLMIPEPFRHGEWRPSKVLKKGTGASPAARSQANNWNRLGASPLFQRPVSARQRQTHAAGHPAQLV